MTSETPRTDHLDIDRADAERLRAGIQDRIRRFHAKADTARSHRNPERQKAYRQAAESLESLV